MRPAIDNVTQATAEELWWGIDWNVLGWLPQGDTVASASWSAVDETGAEDPPLIVIDDDNIVNDVETWVRLTSPTAGVVYLVTVLMISSSGEKGELSLRVHGQ